MAGGKLRSLPSVATSSQKDPSDGAIPVRQLFHQQGKSLGAVGNAENSVGQTNTVLGYFRLTPGVGRGFSWRTVSEIDKER